MAQHKSIQVTGETSVTIDAAAAGYDLHDYMDHGLVFTNLTSITATPTLYPVIAGGNVGIAQAGITQASATAQYTYEEHGIMTKIVIAFDSAFTGWVFLGSGRSVIANNL